MLIETLREHAAVLRSLADELDAMANAAENPTALTLQQQTIYPDPPSSMTDRALELGAFDSAYVISDRVNMDAVRKWARDDLDRGKTVCFYLEETGVIMPITYLELNA